MKEQFRRELDAVGEDEFHRVVPINRVITQEGRSSEKQKTIKPTEVVRMLRTMLNELVSVEGSVQSTEEVCMLGHYFTLFSNCYFVQRLLAII